MTGPGPEDPDRNCLGDGRHHMPVGYRGEAAAFLEGAVEVLLVGFAEYSEHSQREVHILVVVQADPRRPEGAVLTVVGHAEAMAEFLGGETVV